MDAPERLYFVDLILDWDMRYERTSVSDVAYVRADLAGPEGLEPTWASEALIGRDKIAALEKELGELRKLYQNACESELAQERDQWRQRYRDATAFRYREIDRLWDVIQSVADLMRSGDQEAALEALDLELVEHSCDCGESNCSYCNPQ